MTATQAMLNRANRERREAIEERDRLREALEIIVASEPAHDAAYWGLAGHPTIAGADCQTMAWARDIARAALEPKR